MDQETLDRIAEELFQIQLREQAKTPGQPLPMLQKAAAFESHLKSKYDIDSYDDYVDMGGRIKIQLPDGSVKYKGSIVNPDGSVVRPEDSVVRPEDSVAPAQPSIRSFSPLQHYAGLATRGVAEGLAAPLTLPLDAAALAYNIPSYLGVGERTDPQTGETVSGYPRAPYASQEFHQALPLPRPHSAAQRALTGAFQVPAAVASPIGLTRLLRHGAAGTTPVRQLASRYTSTLAANPTAQIQGGYAAIGAGEGAGLYDSRLQLPAALLAGGTVNIQAGRRGGGQEGRDMLADATAQNIRVRPGDLSPSLATPERRSIAGGGHFYRQAAQETLDDTQDAIARLLDKFEGGEGNAQAVLTDLRQQYQAAKDHVRPLFEQARLSAQGHQIPIPNTLRKIKALDLEVRELGPEGTEVRRLMDLIESRMGTEALGGYSGGTLSYDEANEISKQLAQHSRAVEQAAGAAGTEQMAGQASSLAEALKGDVLSWADMAGDAGEAYRDAHQQFSELVLPFRKVKDIYRAARGTADDELDIMADGIVGTLSRGDTRASISQTLLSDQGRRDLAQTILEDAAMAAEGSTGSFKPGAWLSGTQPGPAAKRRALNTVFEGAGVAEDVAQLGRVVGRTGPRAAIDVATAPPTGMLNVGLLSRMGTGGTAALLARQAGVQNPYGLAAAGLAGTLAGPTALDAMHQGFSPYLLRLALSDPTSLPYGAMVAGQSQAQNRNR